MLVVPFLLQDEMVSLRRSHLAPRKEHVMISIYRSLCLLCLIVLGGDICGLSIYYLSHPSRWNLLRPAQFVLLVLISVITAAAEAALHTRLEGDDLEKCRRCTQAFFFSLLVTLVLTYKPL